MNKPTRRWLIAILLLAVLLRVAVAFYFGNAVKPNQDEISYVTLAARLVNGHGYSFPTGWYPFTAADTPTSHWSFLYAAFVAAVYAVTGPYPLAPRLVQAVLGGILLPWLTFRLARRVLASPSPHRGRGLGGAVPLLAAFFAAVYAYFILYAAQVMTETFYICALLWSLERALTLGEALRNPQPATFYLQPATLLGLSLGVATLLRQSILPWVVVLFAWLLWQAVGELKVDGLQVAGSRGSLSALVRARPRPVFGACFRGIAPLLVAGLVLLACIAPFTIRNYRVYGTFLLLSLSRVRDYFEFWPTADSLLLFNVGRVASIGLFLPFMLYGIWIAVRRGQTSGNRNQRAGDRSQGVGSIQPSTFNLQPSTFLLVFVVFYSVLHIATWAMSRYRLPVDAVLLIFAAVGIADLVEHANPQRAYDSA